MPYWFDILAYFLISQFVWYRFFIVLLCAIADITAFIALLIRRHAPLNKSNKKLKHFIFYEYIQFFFRIRYFRRILLNNDTVLSIHTKMEMIEKEKNSIDFNISSIFPLV